MKLQLKTFGVTRELLGGRVVDWQFEGKTVGELKRELFSRYPSLADLQSLQVAVNQTFAEDNQPLTATDEVALIPPMNGG